MRVHAYIIHLMWALLVEILQVACVHVVKTVCDVFLPFLGVEPPQSTTVRLGGIATFSCSASNVYDIGYVVSNVDPTIWASRGISQSTPTYSGSYTTSNLTVEGIMDNNGLQITCRVFVTAATYVDTSPPAVLMIEGWCINV